MQKVCNLFLYLPTLKEKLKREATFAFWKKMYPDEPFDIEPSSLPVDNFSTGFSYDIVKASTRQEVFFYQVSYLVTWCVVV